MHSDATRYDVVIVGAGAVGLFLGHCLHKLGIRFVIVERRKERRPGPRQVTVYPAVLELCERLGLTDVFLSRGIKVTKGLAFKGMKPSGEVDFSKTPQPYNYILTISLFELERLLEERLTAELPGIVRRNTIVEKVTQLEKGIELDVRGASAMSDRLAASFAVGTDAKRSAFREKAGMEFEEAGPGDTFLMGDFEDRTGLGSAATVHLDADGFLESFPLAGGVRRWVMQTEHLEVDPSEPGFADLVQKRTGHNISGALISLLSAFSVEHYCATTFVKGRALVCGEAAHVLSPLGGMGLNIGLLGAWDAAGAIQRVIREKSEAREKLEVFNRSARARAHQTVKREEFFTSFGRAGGHALQRTLALALLSRGPFSDMASRYFTVSAR